MKRTRHRQANASKEYDVLDRATNIVYTARDGTPLYALSYAYDPDGLVTRRVVVSASGAVTNSYAYDGLARLVSESDSLGNSASYAYDLCGNRLSVTTPSGTATSTYTHNRRDADTYDAGGRVTRSVNGRGQTLDLAWNLQGELVSVSTNGAFAEGYAYDPMGRRIATTDSSGTVYHAYDGVHCVADLAPDGSLLRSYTWGAGIDNLLAVTLYGGDSSNTLYAVTDPLGTVHALVGTNGVPAATYAYDSWGNFLSASGGESLVPSLRFAWQGREYSFATGLYNFRARWYDPSTGRWLSKDPIGLEGGLNLYEAFGNNPVCFRDPGGLLEFDLLGTLMPLHSAEGKKEYVGGSLNSQIEYANSINTCCRGPAYKVMLGGAGLYGTVLATATCGPELLLYEIGQKTLTDEVYARYSHLTPVERGRELIADYGWGIALLPQGRGWILGIGKTFSTGPTPLGWVGGGIVLWNAYKYFTKKGEKNDTD